VVVEAVGYGNGDAFEGGCRRGGIGLWLKEIA
jgi:hypothetical protein